jgi:hypothetical protein
MDPEDRDGNTDHVYSQLRQEGSGKTKTVKKVVRKDDLFLVILIIHATYELFATRADSLCAESFFMSHCSKHSDTVGKWRENVSLCKKNFVKRIFVMS